MRAALLRRRGALAASALLAVLAAGLGLAPYLILWDLAARAAERGAPTSEEVWRAGLLALAAVALKAFCAAASTRISHLAAYAALADLRAEAARKLMRLPLGVFEARRPADLRRVLAEDLDQMEDALAHAVPDLAAGLAIPLLSGLALIWVDWRLGLASLILFPALLAIYPATLKATKSQSAAYVQALLAVKSSAAQLARGAREIRAFLRGDSELGRFGEAVRALAAAGEVYATASLGKMAALYAGLRANLIVTLPVGGLLFLTGRVGLADFLLALLLGMGMNAPAFRLILTAGGFFWRMQSAGARISALLETPELPSHAAPRAPEGCAIRFDSASLALGGGFALREVSFTVAPGETVALAGPSGGGKSSILRALARFRDLDSGRILLGGVDLREMAPEALAERLGVVLQEPWLIDDTIRANILMGDPQAGEARLREAARAARVLDFAPDLDLKVGQGGRALSGGERQRVALARALLADRPILLLDEATASLDPETERLVLEALRARSAEGRVLLVAAHRFASLRAADRILYVDEGRILDSGRHEELLERCAPYRRAWADQEAAEGWSLAPAEGGPAPVPEVPPEAAAAPAAADPAPDLSGGLLRGLAALAGPLRADLLRRACPLLALEAAAAALPALVLWVALSAATEGRLTFALLGLSTLGLLAALALQIWANMASHRILWRVQTGAVAALQMRLGRKLLTAPLGEILSREVGALEALLTRTASELNFVTPPAQAMRALVIPGLTALAMAFVDWRMALAALAVLPLFAAALRSGDRIYAETMEDLQAAREALAARIHDFVEGMPTLRAYGLGDGGTRALIEASEAHLAVCRRATFRLTRAMAPGALALEAGFAAILIVGGLLTARGEAALGTWLFFLTLGLVFYGPISDAFELSGLWRQQRSALGRVRELLEIPDLPEPALPRRPASLDLVFEGVSFAHAGVPALSGLDLRLPAGKIHALVGPSGSGKTTLLSLIARFWDPDEGRILLGGVDLREVSPQLRARLFGMALQESFLFEDTIRANIALGRPEASQAEVEAAARAAGCHEFVSRLEAGYETRIGEEGLRLSGGERQRIALARALLKDAPILLLDEATASLDPESEAEIRRVLSRLCAGKTVVLITHRPETLRRVDQIIRLPERPPRASGSAGF